MAVRIWGIDLGAHSVKLCVVQSSFRSFTVESIATAKVPSVEGGHTGLPARWAALGSLLEAPHARPDSVAVALPGAAAATHLLTLPFVEARKLEQTLAFEVEGLIPFELSEVAYDHALLGQVDGKSELLVGVARREAVRELLSGLGELGLDPRTVTLAPLAYQAMLGGALEATPGTEVVLDFGHERTCVLVRSNGKLAFGRSLDGGGAALTRAVAKDLSLSFEEAETLKEGRGSLLEGGEPALVAPLARALQPILREIRQTLKQVTARSKLPLERIWLTGGTSLLPGLDALLSSEFGCPAAPLPTAPGAGEGPLAGQDPRSALALALALSGQSGGRGGRINLRRGDLGFQGDFSKLKGKLGRLAVLAGTLAAMGGLRAYAQIYVLGQREKAVDDAVCATTKRAIGKCFRDVNMAKSSLMGGAGGPSTIPQISALDLLAETTSRLNLDGSKITEMEVGTDEVRLRGEADSFETVDKAVTALRSYHCFKDVQRGRVQRTRDGAKIEYNLDVRSSCGHPQGPK